MVEIKYGDFVRVYDDDYEVVAVEDMVAIGRPRDDSRISVFELDQAEKIDPPEDWPLNSVPRSLEESAYGYLVLLAINRRDRFEAENALSEYKKRVLSKALEAKDEIGWCAEGFREAMEALDIEVPRHRHRIEINLTVTLEAEAEDGEEKTEEFVRHSMSEGGIGFESLLDSDWRDVDLVDTAINSVEVSDA